MNSRFANRHRSAAFTLVEILIVVMILGIMASIVIPQYSSATNESRRATVADQLRLYRDQINIYRAQHNDRWAGTSDAVPGGTVQMFTDQLTTYSDASGATVTAKDATHKFGPYLPTMPLNPISSLKTVKFDWTYDAIPTPDGTTGWIYQPFTGRLSINLGASDANGKTYVSY